MKYCARPAHARAPWRRQTSERKTSCGHNLRKRSRNVTGRPFRARVADRKTCRWRANIAGEGRRVRPQARSGKGREGAGRMVDIKSDSPSIQLATRTGLVFDQVKICSPSDAKPPKADGPPGSSWLRWRVPRSVAPAYVVELCRTDASARGGEKTCTSLLSPRADGITAGYRRGDEASWELLMRFGAESQPLLSRAAAASTSTSAIGAASFS